jgi:ABC-type transport system involved in multi-copper enzyme maturation permease subunit
MSNWLNLFLDGVILCLIQYLAGVPWVAALSLDHAREFFRWSTLKTLLPLSLAGLAGGAMLVALGLQYEQDTEVLQTAGRFYGALLNLQLILDAFVLGFGLLSLFWRRGAAVAIAAFREGVRQPSFAFLGTTALILMLIMPFIPYFTFGEDLKMVRELGYDVVMMFSAIFAVLTASISISEEIEGRTAITLMSKPVSRRQFLIGKFLGILATSLLMTGLLGMAYYFLLWYKPIVDHEPVPIPSAAIYYSSNFSFLDPALLNVVTGACWWFVDAVAASPGLILGFCQVMVLLAIAVALATRLPMVVNLVICLVVFFLGHLGPVLAQASQGRFPLVKFMAQLFDTLLPGLEMFNIGPVLTGDTLPPPGDFAVYIASVAGYAAIYTVIALLLGLILFEDRDLA